MLETPSTQAPAEARFLRLIQIAPVPLCYVDAAGNILYRNAHFIKLFGYTHEDTPTLAEWWLAAYPNAEYRAWVQEHWDKVVTEAAQNHTDIRPVEYRVTCKDGVERIIEISGGVADDTFLATFIDLTDRKKAENQLQLAANVFTCAREGIMITQPDATIIDVNEAFTQITGYTRDELIGCNVRTLKSGRYSEKFYRGLWQQLIAEGHWSGEILNRRKDGEIYVSQLTISAVCDGQKNVLQYVGLYTDISAIKAHQKTLEFNAQHDALTSLPNRSLLSDRLDQVLLQAARKKSKCAVVYCDLDGFKAVNDRYGHAFGDKVLMEASTRMTNALRAEDTLARIGGDEFIAILDDIEGRHTVEPILQRILTAVAQDFIIEGTRVHISISLGATIYSPENKVSADTLQRQADQAMYQVKMADKNGYRFYYAG